MEKKKVLVVDDEENFLKVTKLNLEETGQYEVMVLPNAKDIMQKVNNFMPDIILLDFLMPAVGGIDACEMLNNDPIGKNIPIIIVSALDKYTDRLKAYKAGVVDYLVKPVEAKTLVEKIEKALKFR